MEARKERWRLQTARRMSGLRQRLKMSWIYDAYWARTDPRVIDDRRREVDFYRGLLSGFRRNDLIFDIGANCGQKTDVFLRMGARVVAVDPDEANQEAIKERFLKYRVFPKPVMAVGKAVSDSNKSETLWIDAPGSALNTLSRKWVEALKGGPRRSPSPLDKQEFEMQRQIETTTLDHLIALYGVPFFIKIDVEGYEVAVLRGLHQPVSYLSFEVNLPDFRAEGLECMSLLRRLAPEGKFNYTVGNGCRLIMEKWADCADLSIALGQCSAPSIEVFWKTFGSVDS